MVLDDKMGSRGRGCEAVFIVYVFEHCSHVLLSFILFLFLYGKIYVLANQWHVTKGRRQGVAIYQLKCAGIRLKFENVATVFKF
jgi:hypothetical protein